MTGPTVLYVHGRGTDERLDALESSDLRVIEADDGVDAIKRIDDEPIDCLVVSSSPDERTIERLVRSVRQEHPAVPIISLGEPGKSADGDPTNRTIEYVEPGDADRLPERIRDAIVERRVAQGLDRHRRLKDRTLALATTLPGVDDRRSIERTLYDELSATHLYRFVWLCEYASETDRVRIRHPGVGAIDESSSLIIESEDVPDVLERARRKRRVQATNRQHDTSKSRGSDEFRSRNELVTLAVPFVYEDDVNGVLVLGTDDPDGGDGSERALLSDLGAVVGREFARRSREGSTSTGENGRLERFAQELAHELRNPLGIASAHLDLAEENGEESIDRARAAIDEIDRIVDGLLSLAGGSVHTEELDLEDVSVETWEIVDPASAELVVDGSRTIEADRDLLVRLLANLFRNAVEHGSTSNRAELDDAVEQSSTSSQASPDDAVEHGSRGVNQTEERTGVHTDDGEHDDPDVTVRVGVLDTGFYVEDDGPGVPPGERDQIFEWGYSGAESGAGIGLAVVSTIVTNHGWTIDVTEGRTGGARFEVTHV